VTKEIALMLLALAFAVTLLLLWRGRLNARRLKKGCERGFTDPEQLAELLDEWNRKRRPDLWASGGGWRAGNDSKAEYQEVSTRYCEAGYAETSASGSHI